MRSARALPPSPRRSCANTPPAPSASTPATAAAPPAAAMASSTSRCSSCPTSTCVAANATARAIRAETLQMRIAGADGRRANIAEVLAMTATEALAFFADQPMVCARLQPLVDVGLDYVRLGQPVPTLSGGEAQRLKLAGHLAAAALDSPQSAPGGSDRGERRGRGKLLIFDEPTTGLHFEDIARLVHAFGLLLEAGHSLLVIEHNLDVIRAADWIIDLGPEGGERGGELVAAGTPAAADARAALATGRALAQYAATTAAAGAATVDGDAVAEPVASRCPRCEPHLSAIAAAAVADRAATARPTITVTWSYGRARAQPQERRRRDSARPLHRDHRRVGLRQIDAGVRHPVQRGPAPLPGIAQCLRAPVRAARGAAGPRCHLWHPAHRGDRAARQPRRPQEHGRDADRDLSLPAPDLRATGHAVLSRLRSRDRAAERGVDRRAAAEALSRPIDPAARAADRASQGPLSRARTLGGRARRRRNCASMGNLSRPNRSRA